MRQMLSLLSSLGFLYAAGFIIGYIFALYRLPLPWMIGPLVFTAVVTFSGISKIAVPVATRPFGQLAVASQVALYFTPAAFQTVLQNVPLLIAMAFLISLGSLFVAFLLSRIAKVPLSNALIAVLPTSPVEASITAERHGFDPAPVALSQIIRTSTVVIAVPFVIFIIDGAKVPLRQTAAVDTEAFEFVFLVIVAVIGAALFKRFKVSNPYFLGPLTLIALLNVAGVSLAPFPSWVLNGAQIVLGTWLGSTFRRALFISAGRYLTFTIAFSILFVAVCAFLGMTVSYLLNLPLDLMLLASAPGGVTEMALTAKVLGADTSLITAFHVTRIFIIMPNISWIVAAFNRYEARSKPQ